MQIVFAFIPLLILAAGPSVVVKFAALLIRAKLSWKHCFVFGCAVAVMSVLGRLISHLTGRDLPIPLAVIFGVGLNLGLGSWYFSSRGLDKAGNAVGVRGGFKLMLIYLLLLSLVVASMFALAYMLSRGNPSAPSAVGG